LGAFCDGSDLSFAVMAIPTATGEHVIARVAGLSAPGRQRPLCTVDRSQRATILLKPLSARAPEDLDRLRLCAKPGPAFHRNPIKPGFRRILAQSRLYDLDRLERMILRRVTREYFLLEGESGDD
jgi:hypothetical protein